MVALALTAVCPTAFAQNTKSQLGTVTQMVAGTKIDLTYRRPVARGRTTSGDIEQRASNFLAIS